MNMSARRPRVRRRGAVMIAALVCLLIISMLVTSMLQSALRGRRQLRMEHHARQTMLLLQAGVEHSQAHLARAQDYQGETLQLPIPGRSAAEVGAVAIVAEAIPGEQRTSVQVVARYPLDSPQLVQRTLHFTYSHSTR